MDGCWNDGMGMHEGRWKIHFSEHGSSGKRPHIIKNAQKVRNRRTKVRKSSAKSKEIFLI